MGIIQILKTDYETSVMKHARHETGHVLLTVSVVNKKIKRLKVDSEYARVTTLHPAKTSESYVIHLV